MYTEKYKMLKTQINRKVFCVHGLQELTFSKAVYKFSTAPAKIPMAFSTDREKKNVKNCMKSQDLEKEEQSWRHHAL